MRVYIINEHVTRKKLNDRTHYGYFMGYADTTGVILYWNCDHTFSIHRYHNDQFSDCNSNLYIQEKHTTGYLLLQRYPESLLHYLYPINLIICEIDLTCTQFFDTTILTYEIQLPPDAKEIGFNLFDDGDFTIPYVIYKTSNSTASHQVPTQAKENVCIIYFNREHSITSERTLDELQYYRTQNCKYKVKISLCRSNIYQRAYLEEIQSIFD